MEQTAMRGLGRSEPQGSGMLRQMKFLCSTVQRLGQQMHDVQRLRQQMQDVQCLGKQMQDGFAAERVERQENFASMRKEMKDEMGEGFKNERMAREQAQKEMRSDIRSDIRSEIRSEMDFMKEELEKLKRGSGSTVRSEHCGGFWRFRHLCSATAIDRYKIPKPFLATQDGVQRLDRSPRPV